MQPLVFWLLGLCATDTDTSPLNTPVRGVVVLVALPDWTQNEVAWANVFNTGWLCCCRVVRWLGWGQCGFEGWRQLRWPKPLKQLTFAPRFYEGAAGVDDDDMDDKMMPSDITAGAEVDKEEGYGIPSIINWTKAYSWTLQRGWVVLFTLFFSSHCAPGTLSPYLWGCLRGSIVGNRRWGAGTQVST